MEEQLDDTCKILRQHEERLSQSAASNRIRESHMVSLFQTMYASVDYLDWYHDFELIATIWIELGLAKVFKVLQVKQLQIENNRWRK